MKHMCAQIQEHVKQWSDHSELHVSRTGVSGVNRCCFSVHRSASQMQANGDSVKTAVAMTDSVCKSLLRSVCIRHGSHGILLHSAR